MLMLEAIICIVLIVVGCATRDSEFFIAAGLFAVAANISEMNRKDD